jgi:hypothetical protein
MNVSKRLRLLMRREMRLLTMMAVAVAASALLTALLPPTRGKGSDLAFLLRQNAS